MTLSVVIPVYNGEATIRELAEEIRKSIAGGVSYEIIIVADPGKDKSREMASEISAEDPQHIAVCLPETRLGQHKALLLGIEKSSGDLIVTMDDDLQHDPSFIGAMMKELEHGGHDVVYAVFSELSHGCPRKIASEAFRKLITRFIPGLCKFYSPYRIIRSETAKKILTFSTPYVFIDAYLGKVTSKFGSVQAVHRKRGGGKSAYGFFRLAKHALLIIWHYGMKVKKEKG